MNKQEFLKALADELRDFPAEERTQAIQFYTEYFEDAGTENEACVLQELGSPQKVAQILRANCKDAHTPSDEPSSAKDTKTASDSAYSSSDIKYNDRPRYDAYDYSQTMSGQNVPPRRHGGNTALICILLVVTCPLWIGLLAGIFGILCAVFFTLLGLIVAGIAIAAACFVSLYACIRLLGASLPVGILMLGFCLAGIGGGILLTAGLVWCLYKASFFVFHFCKRLWQNLSAKREEYL